MTDSGKLTHSAESAPPVSEFLHSLRRRLKGVFPEILERFDQAHHTLDRAEALRAEASAEIRAVVADLRSEQLTYRDIAALLDITPQRVAQLAPTEVDK